MSNVSPEALDTLDANVIRHSPVEPERTSASIHLISGASAGLISAILLQPFDLLKTRLQQQQLQNKQLKTTISKELKKLTTVKDLWRGALPSALRTSIGAGLYFTILSKTRIYISTLKTNNEASSTSSLPKLSHAENLMSGFVVRAVVGVITMPITVIKTRFESNIYNYNSMYEGFENIYRGTNTNPDVAPPKASLRNFFTGSYATLARDCPYAGLYVLFYESFKNDLMPYLLNPFDSLMRDENAVTKSTITNSSSAVLAASVATTITAPFDAIKTRLQLNTIHNTKPGGIWSTTKLLCQEPGGVKNLFRGLSLRLGRKGLSAGISWCIYEESIKPNSFFNTWTKKSVKLV